MRPALLVFSYAVALAWILPLPLRRLSEPGASPRLALAAWLTAMISVLACVMTVLGLLARAATQGGRRSRGPCASRSAPDRALRRCTGAPPTSSVSRPRPSSAVLS
jgi:hypothetical protein